MGQLQVDKCMCNWYPHKRDEKRRNQENIWRSNGQNCSKFNENYNQKQLTKFKEQEKNEENYTKAHNIQMH